MYPDNNGFGLGLTSGPSNGKRVFKISKGKYFVVCFCLLQETISDSTGTLTNAEAVSQFTILASTNKGNKPDFHKAADPAKAKELYEWFFSKIQELYEPEKVKNGIFQAMMEVELKNDGPVGVDYTCEDGAVNTECRLVMFSTPVLANTDLKNLGHLRD